jgi:limonene-1,2-epoxide hydrolase
MDVNFVETLLRYKKFWDEISVEKVEGFREFAEPNIHYHDPWTDTKGVDAVVAALKKWFSNMEEMKFEILEFAPDGRLLFSYWRMTFRVKKAPKKVWELYGVSKTIFDEAGLVEDQADYYDVSRLLEYFPVLGRVVTMVKKQFSG